METFNFKCDINSKAYDIDINKIGGYRATIKEDINTKKSNYIEMLRFRIDTKEASALLNKEMLIHIYRSDISDIQLRTKNIILRVYIMNYECNEWEVLYVKNISYTDLKTSSGEFDCEIAFKINNKLNYINKKDLSMQFKFITVPNGVYKLFSKNKEAKI